MRECGVGRSGPVERRGARTAMPDRVHAVRHVGKLGRRLRAALILGCLFSGCTCAGNPPPAATPTLRPPDTATAAPRDTATPLPAAPSPAVSPTVSGERATCERDIAVLSGREQDSTVLDRPEIRRLADADLVMCGAVFSDSDTMCQKLMPEEHGPSRDCLHTQSIFHELRAYPGTRSFLFDEADFSECRAIPGLATMCTSLRQALRSGDPKACAQLGDAESVCRAYMDMDKSRCRVTGKLATLEVERPGERKPGESSKAKVKDWIEETCRQNIGDRAVLAKGLQELAQSGQPRQRELAKAALKQEDACQSYAQLAMQSCTAPSAQGSAPAGAPAAGISPGGTAAPATPGVGPG